MKSAIPDDVSIGVAEVLELEAVATSITASTPLGGGCINPAAAIETVRGESFFLKWSDDPGDAAFGVEARGLGALRSAGGPRVPEVIGFSDGSAAARGWILLELIRTGTPGPATSTCLGYELAALHRTSAAELPGWHEDGRIGPLPQDNRNRGRSWPRFWLEARLQPQWERAHGWFDEALRRDWERLTPLLDAALEGSVAEGVSLLHGDLWSGNVLVADDGLPVLIDPATYRGHREVDVAMMELFGGFSADTLAAYRERAPLAPDYEDVRRDCYQIYPLLVHVNLFGAGYLTRVGSAINRLLCRLS